jgi:thiamine-phosphate pyrophosphorylase
VRFRRNGKVRELIQDRSTPMVYVITDRRLLSNQTKGPDLTFLHDFIEQAAIAGADMVQVRERDITARALYDLTEALARPARTVGASLLVNDRADIAASTGAGVHLTTRSLRADVVRTAFGGDLLIGVSTHTKEEAQAAERDGADFAVFGPIFETESKKEYGEPVGLEELRRVTRRLSIPVLALGGMKLSNYRDALKAGAAGIAGISMFAEARDLSKLVAAIKASSVG